MRNFNLFYSKISGKIKSKAETAKSISPVIDKLFIILCLGGYIKSLTKFTKNLIRPYSRLKF
jgi:imidazole glycerol phosphate synthase subunit HisF